MKSDPDETGIADPDETRISDPNGPESVIPLGRYAHLELLARYIIDAVPPYKG